MSGSSDTLHVTYVDTVQNLLRIWGQKDKNSGQFIAEYLQQLSTKLDKIGSPVSRHIQKGTLCFVHGKGYYYRARTVSNLQNEKVHVFFIDYGNTEFVHISDIKIQEIDEILTKMPGQAKEFYLARVIAPTGGWTDKIISKIRNDICYKEICFTILAQPADQKIIELKLENEDFSNLLLKEQKFQSITIQEQTQIILSYCSLMTHDVKQKLPLDIVKPDFSHHLDKPINSKSLLGHLPKKLPFQCNYEKLNKPLIHSNCSLAQNSNSKPVDQICLISDKINLIDSQYYPKIFQKVSCNNLQPYNSEYETFLDNPSNTIKKINYKPEQLLNTSNNAIIEVLTQQLKQFISIDNSKADIMFDRIPHNYVNPLLEVGSTHNIIVSHIDDGPWSFSVQTVSSENELNKLMEELTMIELIPLKPPLVLGHPCIGASGVYKNLCRGVIVGISHNATRVYFVDFGNTEDLPISSIFELPQKFFSTKVLSQKFCLSGLHKVPYSNQIKVYFKEVVNDELLMLRITSLEGDNLPSCDLYLKNKNIKRILNHKILNSKYSLEDRYKPGDMENVVVTWVENPQRFYVQLKKQDGELNALKEELSNIYSKSKMLTFQDLMVGLKCICKYSSDGQWYRVMITSVLSECNISVFYVDYGNSEIVEISCLRKIEGNGLLNQISNQAIECCLQGFENKIFDRDLIRKLEKLTLDKDLKIIISSIDKEKLFVRLFEKNIDINTLLSRSNQKVKNCKDKVSTLVNLTKSNQGSEKNNFKTLKEKQNNNNFSDKTKFKKEIQQDRNNPEKTIYGDHSIYNDNFQSKKINFKEDIVNKSFSRRNKKDFKEENKFEESRTKFENCRESHSFHDEYYHPKDLGEFEYFREKKKT